MTIEFSNLLKQICLTILLIFFVGSISIGQQSQTLQESELEEINRVISVFENALKTTDASLLEDYLNKGFSCMGYPAPVGKNNVLPQVLQQMPKGDIEIVNSNKDAAFIYHLDLILANQVPLKMELDVDFHILNLESTSSSAPSKENAAPELSAKQISLPFHLLNGFILIEAEIDGKKGKLMFDTGSSDFISLNNNYLTNLDKKNKIGEGAVSSGQKMTIYESRVDKLSLGYDCTIESVGNIMHGNYDFIQEGITQDFMGFIGYNFFKNYEFIIDYDLQLIEMFLITPNQENKFYEEDEIVAELDFLTPLLPNMPYVNFQCKGLQIKAIFDTGNQGFLHLKNKKLKTYTESQLLNENQLNGVYGQPGEIISYTIDDLEYNGIELEPIKNLSNSEAGAMPITDETDFDLGLGYQFLKNYRSVWNFETQKIVLLKR